MLTGEVKQILIDILADKISKHQDSRKVVSEEVVDQFMKPRKLEFGPQWEKNKM